MGCHMNCGRATGPDWAMGRVGSFLGFWSFSVVVRMDFDRDKAVKRRVPTLDGAAGGQVCC